MLKRFETILLVRDCAKKFTRLSSGIQAILRIATTKGISERSFGTAGYIFSRAEGMSRGRVVCSILLLHEICRLSTAVTDAPPCTACA